VVDAGIRKERQLDAPQAPATASARQRNSLGKQFITASRRQPAPARLLLGTLLAE